jgi:hypothetical protein
MARNASNPNTINLVTIDPISGEVAVVGTESPRHELLGVTSGLGTVVNDVYYYLADNSQGQTVLVGLNVQDSTEVCFAEVAEIAQTAFVGASQTLNYDAGRQRLVLSGPHPGLGHNFHSVLEAELDTCATTVVNKTYGKSNSSSSSSSSSRVVKGLEERRTPSRK